MGKSTISMVIFNSYVKLPEGRSIHLKSERPKILRWNRVPGPIYLQLCIGFVGKIFTGFTMSGWWCWWCVLTISKKYMSSSMGLGWHPIYEMENKHCLKPPTRCFFSHDIWGCSGFNMSFNQSIEPNWSTPKKGGRIGASILTHTPTPQPSNQVSLNDGQSCKEIG